MYKAISGVGVPISGSSTALRLDANERPAESTDGVTLRSAYRTDARTKDVVIERELLQTKPNGHYTASCDE